MGYAMAASGRMQYDYKQTNSDVSDILCSVYVTIWGERYALTMVQ